MPEPATMRCFLALPLSDEFRDVISNTFSEVKKPKSIRLISEDLWHVTLAFLGDVPESNIGAIVRACAHETRRPGAITFSRFESFPTGSPRLLVASGHADPVTPWKTFINGLQASLAPFAPEMDRKPWHPHITIARSEKKESLVRWSAPAGPWTWTPGGFILYESKLNPNGATHRVVKEFLFKH